MIETTSGERERERENKNIGNAASFFFSFFLC